MRYYSQNSSQPLHARRAAGRSASVNSVAQDGVRTRLGRRGAAAGVASLLVSAVVTIGTGTGAQAQACNTDGGLKTCVAPTPKTTVAPPTLPPQPAGATANCGEGVKPYTVPPNVHVLFARVQGGAGGRSSGGGPDFVTDGGGGAVLTAHVRVTPGEVIGLHAGCAGESLTALSGGRGAGGIGYVNAGAGGSSGQMPRFGAGGGAASALLRLGYPIMEAGGGGGAGGSYSLADWDGGRGGDAGFPGAAGLGSYAGGGGASAATTVGASAPAGDEPGPANPGAGGGGGGGGYQSGAGGQNGWWNGGGGGGGGSSYFGRDGVTMINIGPGPLLTNGVVYVQPVDDVDGTLTKFDYPFNPRVWALTTQANGPVGNHVIAALTGDPSFGTSYVDGYANHIAVAPNGQPWVTSVEGTVSRRLLGSVDYVDGTWQNVTLPEKVRDLAIGADGSVWFLYGAADSAGNYRIANYDPATSKWTAVAGTAKQILAGAMGKPYVITNARVIFARTSVNNSYLTGTWQQLAGGIDDAAVGEDGLLWLLYGNADSVGNYPITTYNPATNAWVGATGTAQSIAAGRDGQPWVRSAAGRLWQRSKEATFYQLGNYNAIRTGWFEVGGPLLLEIAVPVATA